MCAIEFKKKLPEFMGNTLTDNKNGAQGGAFHYL